MSAIITGVGAVSSLGPDVAALAQGLRDGRCGCALHEFAYLGDKKISAPAYLAVPADAKGLIDPKKLRRMDRLSKMSAVAARQALNAAGIDMSTVDPARAGIVFGTAFGAMGTTQGFIDSWLKQGEKHASPLNFMNSVHGIMASLIALDLGVTAVNLTISQRDLSFEGALVTALRLIEQGDADLLLVGASDEMTPLLHDFAARLQYVSTDIGARGLDPWSGRGPTIPGDGAAVIMLEREGSPRKALARLEAAEMGRLPGIGRKGGGIAQNSSGAVGLIGKFKHVIDLATTNRGGAARARPLADRRDKALDGMLGKRVAKLTHRGNFGDYPTAGALQCVANVLMLSGGEVFAPLSGGVRRRDLIAGLTPPRAILHDAASTSGSHVAYVLTKV